MGKHEGTLPSPLLTSELSIVNLRDSWLGFIRTVHTILVYYTTVYVREYVVSPSKGMVSTSLPLTLSSGRGTSYYTHKHTILSQLHQEEVYSQQERRQYNRPTGNETDQRTDREMNSETGREMD